jgi:hypothetical protein
MEHAKFTECFKISRRVTALVVEEKFSPSKFLDARETVRKSVSGNI